MTKSRLEAFSDGVIAIIVTIMVLEIKVPHDPTPAALVRLAPVFFSYLLSFAFVCIYWGNHHHLLHTLHHVNTKVIWANMHLLFWLSLIPFSTGWMGENHFAQYPVALYAINMLICAIAFYILQKAIQAQHTSLGALAEALAKQERKGIISVVLYIAAVACAFVQPVISEVLIVITAIMWVIPDRNIEKALKEEHKG